MKWTRVRPGLYRSGQWSIIRDPNPRTPDRPWALDRMLTAPGSLIQGHVREGRFHTLTLAKRAAW